MEILIATNNLNKVKEYQEILSPLGFKCLSLNDLNINCDPNEVGTTFSENAYINRLLGFIKIGAIPEALKNIYLEFTPIDITANSIINLVTHPNKNNRIFHLFNNNHVYLNKISKYLKQLNENFEIIGEENFKNKIRKILNNLLIPTKPL